MTHQIQACVSGHRLGALNGGIIILTNPLPVTVVEQLIVEVSTRVDRYLDYCRSQMRRYNGL